MARTCMYQQPGSLTADLNMPRIVLKNVQYMCSTLTKVVDTHAQRRYRRQDVAHTAACMRRCQDGASAWWNMCMAEHVHGGQGFVIKQASGPGTLTL